MGQGRIASSVVGELFREEVHVFSGIGGVLRRRPALNRSAVTELPNWAVASGA